MNENNTTTVEPTREPPSFEGLMEEQFMRDLRKALDAWRKAGKPHKR